MIYGELALKYLDAGYLTIPLLEKSKKPFFDDWALTGFVTEEKVKLWATQYPNANIGLPTGETNGILVIDIDDLEKIEKIQEIYNIDLSSFILPITKTRKGVHLYFKYPKNKIIRNYVKFKGLFDVRSTGGQVVIPTSIHPETKLPYEWMIDENGNEFSLFTIKKEDLPEVPLSILHDIVAENEKDIIRRERIIDFITSELGKINSQLDDYGEWLNCGFAIAHALGERGREYFLRLCWDSNNGNKQYTHCLRSEQRKYRINKKLITIATLIRIATKYEIEIPQDLKITVENVFWQIDEDGKINYMTEIMGTFLSEELNFYSCKWEEGRKFIKERDNIIIEVDVIDILKEMKEYIAEAENANAQVIEFINKSVNGLFTDKFFHTILKEKEIDIARDKEDEVYFYFRNGYYSVTKNSTIFHNYNELAWCIWESQIIDWDFKFELSYQESEFYTFLWNVCNKKAEKVVYAMQLIGYLTHTYNNPSNMRAVILVDENSNKRESNGRTGKSLFGKMFSQTGIRKVVEQKAKNLNLESQFAWQEIKLDTQIIFLNDVKSDFQFEDLFNVVSDGITIERKNKTAFSIPLERSPKILITTNRLLLGQGDSFEGRKYELEFCNHYNKNFSPADEFGHNLYEWKDEKQWNCFYSLVLTCCQIYLNDGIIPYKSENLLYNKFKQSTNDDFVEFILGYNFINHINYDKKELYENFISEYGEYKAITQRTFSNYFTIFLNIFNVEYDEKKSHGKYYLCFENITEKQEEILKTNEIMQENWKREKTNEK